MSKNIFNSVKLYKPNKNAFDLTHDKKMSFDIGGLYPVMCIDCVPGDKFNISTECLVKMAPMVAPPMQRLDVYIHTFFVPKRILWANWEKFITRTEVDGDIPVFPYITYGDDNMIFNGGLMDFLGLPQTFPSGNTDVNVSAMPQAAYQKIWLEYFRDQNLEPDEISLPDGYILVDGDNTSNAQLYFLHARCWAKDYFTSALPWAQKGEIVRIPFEDAQVLANNGGSSTTLGGSPTNQILHGGVADGNEVPDGDMFANTSDAAGTINDLTFAQRLQEWFEKMARGGSRYIEQIKEHFGVFSSDKRLQRPEYIGGSKSPIIIGEILNTAGLGGLPQGNMAGKGTSANYSEGSSYYCEEHGYIMSIMSVLPRASYSQGIPKHFLKVNDAYEHFWPSFAHLGEQVIDRNELFAWAGNDIEFGYTPRYAEYKFEQSTFHGDFRTDLDFWHLGRIFATPPALSSEFVRCTPEQNERIFAVTAGAVNKLYAHVLNKVYASRPMPKYGTPIH